VEISGDAQSARRYSRQQRYRPLLPSPRALTHSAPHPTPARKMWPQRRSPHIIPAHFWRSGRLTRNVWAQRRSATLNCHFSGHGCGPLGLALETWRLGPGAPGATGAGRLLREVFAVEDVADTGVVEHRAERFCDQRRNREDFDVRELLLGRERQRVGQDDLFEGAVLEPIDRRT
jgi:hypothetical protein